MSIYIIMRAEIDVAADRAKQEIHDQVVQAAKELGCLQEYLLLTSPFTPEIRREFVEAFNKAHRSCWGELRPKNNCRTSTR